MRSLGWLGLAAMVLIACGGDGDDGSTNSSGTGGTSTSSGPGGSGASGGVGGTGAGGAGPTSCEPLPAPSGDTLELGPTDDVPAAVSQAAAGTTILLQDGTYDLTGSSIWITQPGVSLRGASGDASAVVLEGGYDTSGGGLVNVASVSDVTIADLTIMHPRYHAIHVTATDADVLNTLIYDVRLFDPGEQAIKINHASNGFYPDQGEVACSHIELTEAGRQQVMSYTSSGSNCYTGGVDAHGARGWLVRDNYITGFWCSNGDLSEHGIHFWTGSRDTRVERNVLVDNARAIGFGLTSNGRTYGDDPCPGVSEASHYGGSVTDNFIIATDDGLFASPNGMDTGISFWYACRATAAHNTVASDDAPFSSIEWRFDITDVTLTNNLATHTLRERDGAIGLQAGNIADAPASDFVDLAGHDIHLAAGASALDQGDPSGASITPTDIDGDDRSMTAPDVGADEQ